MRGEKASQTMKQISLSNDTIKSRIHEMSDNIKSKVISKSNFSFVFTFQLDESNLSQLLVYIRYVADKRINKKFFFCQPLETTSITADVFQVLIDFFDKTELSWSKPVGVGTDDAPAMIGANSGLVSLIKQKNPTIQGTNCMIHKAALVSKTIPKRLYEHLSVLRERIIEARLRDRVEISKQQYGFMPGKGTTNAMFALRMLMEKYREGQRELHCVFVDLEKAYDRVPREELWYCMRKSGIVEKYVRLVQDMYEGSETVVRCAVGTTESFNVKVGLHQISALSPFLFAVIMDRLTDEVRREPLWTMLFADDIVICEETREEVEQRLESWKYALERRGMKVSRSKTEYLCINGGNDDETVKMEDAKVPRVKEFKYLG